MKIIKLLDEFSNVNKYSNNIYSRVIPNTKYPNKLDLYAPITCRIFENMSIAGMPMPSTLVEKNK